MDREEAIQQAKSEAEAMYPRLKVILNSENRGFEHGLTEFAGAQHEQHGNDDGRGLHDAAAAHACTFGHSSPCFRDGDLWAHAPESHRSRIELASARATICGRPEESTRRTSRRPKSSNGHGGDIDTAGFWLHGVV